MAKVNFIYKNGRQKSMDESYAKILQKIGQGQYSTATMENKAITKPMVAEIKPEPFITDELDGKNIDELREIAEANGIKVHHKAGAQKIREAIRGK